MTIAGEMPIGGGEDEVDHLPSPERIGHSLRPPASELTMPS